MKKFILPGLWLLAAALYPQTAGGAASPRSLLSRQLTGRPDISAGVVRAVGETPREALVPPGWESWTYEDRPLPLGGGLFLPSPSDCARLLSAASLQGSDQVLVVGRACGYAALLACRLAGSVTVMEEDDGQRELLSQILNAPGNEEFLQKITLLGDWSLAFLPRNQSFSAIIIHGGTGNIPPVLLGLLRAPGRLAGVIRTDSGFSLVITLTRNTDGEGLRGGAEVYFPAILGW